MTTPINPYRAAARVGAIVRTWTRDGGRSVQVHAARRSPRRRPSIRRALVVAAISLAATAETPPPASLAAYIKDGRFDPGDYGWMRGNFPDATPKQRDDWAAIGAWHHRCWSQQMAAIRVALVDRGLASTAVVEVAGDGLCGDLSYAMGTGGRTKSWSDFQAAVARARPVAQAITWSAALAQSVADPDSPTEATLLVARPMTDQVIRSSLSWDKGAIAGAPPLDDAALDVTRALLGLAFARRDHANTAWLKALVARDGWPSIPKVGKDASHMAWLLVQHADDDPVFQLDMLRLMEPLAARGEVAKKDDAFLYDRVMLKLTGRQRYGSQFTCTGGHRVPLPLENLAKVDALRRGMGMNTVAARTVELDKSYGPCPPDVIPPSPAKR